MEIVWSRYALARLAQTTDVIARDSIKRAVAFEESILQAVGRLAKFPFSGPLAAENPAFRQLVHRGYRAIYRVGDRRVEIVAFVAPGLDAERELNRVAQRPKLRR